MSTIIFTTAISGKSGIDKSVIYTANVLVENGVDTHIYSIVDNNAGSTYFSFPNFFDLDKKVKSHSLLDYCIKDDDKIQLLDDIVMKVQHPFLKLNINKYHLKAMKEICEKLNKDDTIIFATPIASEMYVKSKSQTEAFKIIQIHSDYQFDKDNMKHLKNSYKNVDLIQTVAKEMIPYLKKKFSLKDNQITAIYNVISMDDQAKIIQRSKSKNFRLAIIGSLQERKNQMDALKMMEHLDNYYSLHIYGEPQGEYYDEMVDYINLNKLNEKVKFEGYKNEQEMYSNTDLVIATSKSEGFGYTLAEAIKNGIPIVSYNYLYGASEIVDEGLNGYLVDDGEYEKMAQIISQITIDDKYQKMCEEGVRSYKRKFSKDSIFKEYQRYITKTDEKAIHEKFPLKKLYDFTAFVQEKYLSKYKKVNVEIMCNDDFLNNHKISSVVHVRNGKFSSLKYQMDGNKIITDIDGFSNYRGYSIFIIDDNNNYHYVFTMNWSGKIEKINRYNLFEIKHDDKLNIYDKYMNRLYIPLGFKERIIAIKDSNNNELSFETSVSIKINTLYQNAVIVDGVNSDIIVEIQNHEDLILKKENFNSYSYDMLWKSLLEIEKEHNLFSRDIEGVKYWDLIKSPLIIELVKEKYLWLEPKNRNKSNIVNIKKIQKTTKMSNNKRKLICNVGYNYGLYEKLIDENTLIHVNNPEAYVKYYIKYGDTVGLHDLKLINKKTKLNDIEKQKIYEDSKKLSLIINWEYQKIYNLIEQRYIKFKNSYNFYYQYLKDSNIEEVIVVSGIWDQGITAAAKDLNIKTSELQYAFIADNHLNYGLTYDRNYAPDDIYLWSDYWRDKSDFAKNQISLTDNNKYQYAVVSQHLLSKYTIKLANELASIDDSKKVCVLLHPQENLQKSDFEYDNIDLVKGDTKNQISNSKYIFGYFSTALFERVDKSNVYVVETPGFEMTWQEKKFKTIKICEVAKRFNE